MKVAYVTTYDVQAPETWPKRHLGLYGAGRKIAQTLESLDIELDYLGPLVKPRTPIGVAKLLFYRHFTDRDFYSLAEPSVLRNYARQVERKLRCSNSDLVLCAENAVPLAYLKCDRPLILWTDTPLGSLVGFYKYMTNLCAETHRNIFRIEQAALDRCQVLIVTSDWAAKKAIELYNLPPNKIRIIPRGSNHQRQWTQSEVVNWICQKPMEPCRLLFVGVDWHRKGGDIALATAQHLDQAGLVVELHVVGCHPKTSDLLPDFVKVHGFIDRGHSAGEQHYINLLKQTHFLLFPTRADAFANAISEASAYGVPTLASEVGGIPTIVHSDVNGYVFPLDADASAYGETILKIVANSDDYLTLAKGALQTFEDHLSWEASRQKIQTCLNELVT